MSFKRMVHSVGSIHLCCWWCIFCGYHKRLIHYNGFMLCCCKMDMETLKPVSIKLQHLYIMFLMRWVYESLLACFWLFLGGYTFHFLLHKHTQTNNNNLYKTKTFAERGRLFDVIHQEKNIIMSSKAYREESKNNLHHMINRKVYP